MSRSNNKRPVTPPQPLRQSPWRTQRWVWLAGTVLIGAMVVAIALSATGQPSTDTTAESDQAAVAAGSELYAANCAVCHGVDLRGTDTGPPFLNVIYAPNHHGDEAFQRAVSGGVVPHHWNFGPMAPIERLTREDVALIVEFVRSQQEAAGIVSDPSHPG